MDSIVFQRINAKLLRLDNPVRSLTLAFWLWKALLFIVITACPGPGYDTSTTLIPREDVNAVSQSQADSFPLSLKFARWDAIYFLHAAEQGYVFEQEWAFGYPRFLGFFISGMFDTADELGPRSLIACRHPLVRRFRRSRQHCIGGCSLVPRCALSLGLIAVSPLHQYLWARDSYSKTHLLFICCAAHHLPSRRISLCAVWRIDFLLSQYLRLLRLYIVPRRGA